MDKEKVVWYTTENFSDFKKKEILPSATTWMNLEDILLSEIGWSQKDGNGRIAHTGVV